MSTEKVLQNTTNPVTFQKTEEVQKSAVGKQPKVDTAQTEARNSTKADSKAVDKSEESDSESDDESGDDSDDSSSSDDDVETEDSSEEEEPKDKPLTKSEKIPVIQRNVKPGGKQSAPSGPAHNKDSTSEDEDTEEEEDNKQKKPPATSRHVQKLRRAPNRAQTVPARPAEPVAIPLTSQIKASWLKKFEQLPVSKDLPRMFPNITIVKNGGEVWRRFSSETNVPSMNNQTQSPTLPSSLPKSTSTTTPSGPSSGQTRISKEEGLKRFIMQLANQLKEHDVARRTDARFFEFVPDGNSDKGLQIMPTQFDKFLQQIVGEESGVIGILKCINQAVVVPAVMALRLHFMKHKINYKDCRGQWNVNISFEDEKVVVTHQKWEETVPRKFEFCWHLGIHLNISGTELLATDLRIGELNFVEEIPLQQKKQVYEVIKEYYTPPPE